MQKFAYVLKEQHLWWEDFIFWPLKGHTGTRFSGSTLHLSLLLDFDYRLLEPCILVYGSKINVHACALTH